LKELNDPFIVKYIDAIQLNNRIYLVLEYLEGGSLGSLVQKTPLEEKLVKKYIKQVLKGLEYLHKHHVAHRDLKGTNILLTKEGKAKITDFGVAIQVNDTQKTLSSAGTPYWMAPEAIINEAATSVECDIWSLGCTVIELLTGNPPYHDLMPYPALFRIV
jgi:serine/threonine protein kinase